MGPNPEVWPMLWLSIGVAVIAAWIGDLAGAAAILASIAGPSCWDEEAMKTVRANHLTERPNIMLQNPWHALSGNPGLAGTILLAGFIGVMAWAWWPAGFLLP